MANPTPIYVVTYNAEQLPGYVQTDDRPLTLNNVVNRPFGRDGANVARAGAGLREISLTFLIKSRAENVSNLLHLEDLMNQYREATAILTRPTTEQALMIHDDDRYYMATVESLSMPMSASQSRSLIYNVKFLAQPWAFGATPLTTTFTGTGTATVTGLDDSRRAYPVITIPSGVTGLIASDGNGHTLSFTRGAVTGTVTVNCANMTVVDGSGVNAVVSLNSLNFGLYYEPNVDGELDLSVSSFTGSGTVGVSVTPRYEM